MLRNQKYTHDSPITDATIETMYRIGSTTLAQRPTVIRWTNIVLPILYIVSIVASVIGESWVYFWFLSIAEGVLLLLIIWYAWRWPTLDR